jgi:hypothetical protein
MSNKDREHLFSYHKKMALGTPAFRGIPLFPDAVEHVRDLEELVWWLGTTDFSASTLGGGAVALSQLSLLHCQVDFSYHGFMQLLSYLTNLDTPGFFIERERKHTDDPSPQTIRHYEASRGIARAVRERPHLRKATAQYVIFEDLGCYDEVTLAQIAERVEQEYRWEYGDKGFVSSTRNMANALAGTETERESLGKMLTLALEIGSHHIRSRLAVNWLAQVQLCDPALQQTLEHLKTTSMKQIWLRKMTTYSSDDPEFLNVLQRGGTLDGNQN